MNVNPNIPKLPAWSNEALVSPEISAQETILAHNQEMVITIGEHQPILGIEETRDRLGVTGKLTELVGMGSEAAVAVVDVRDAPTRPKTNVWEDQIKGEKRVIRTELDGTEIVVYGDHVAIIEANNGKNAEVRSLEPGVLFKIGREQLDGSRLPDTVSRHQLDIGIGSDGKLHVRNQKPTNPTRVIVGPKAQTERKPDRDRRPRVMQVVDPSSGRIVDYGQMRHGDHPEGGRVVGYR